MRSILVAPAWDTTLEPLCRALVVAQRHRPRPHPLCFVHEIATASATVDNRKRSGIAVLVIVQPGLDAGRPAERAWMEALRSVRERHPALPIAVVVAAPTAAGVRRLAAAGATEVIVWEEEATDAALALRIARASGSRSTRAFLRPLRAYLSAPCELTLFRLLEDLQDGRVSTESDLLRAGGWSLAWIQRGFAASGIGSFGEWCERARVYAAVSRLAQEGVAPETAATACGFADVDELGAGCLRYVGVELDEAADEEFLGIIPDAMVSRAIEVGAETDRPNAPSEDADEMAASDPWPTAEDRAFMLDRYRPRDPRFAGRRGGYRAGSVGAALAPSGAVPKARRVLHASGGAGASRTRVHGAHGSQRRARASPHEGAPAGTGHVACSRTDPDCCRTTRTRLCPARYCGANSGGAPCRPGRCCLARAGAWLAIRRPHHPSGCVSVVGSRVAESGSGGVARWACVAL